MEQRQQNIVVLTGAGISAESGLATFRGADGLWNNCRVEDVATVEAFAKNPDYVHRFYNEMKPQLKAAKPNPAHKALALLEKEYPGRVTVVTQNIDLLHEEAGSRSVLHIHGRIDEAVCLRCGGIRRSWDEVDARTACPYCGRTGTMKPNIVFFGETPLYMAEVEQELKGCGLFLSVGTSGVVYPAAGFVRTVRFYGASAVEFNLEKTSNNTLFERHVYGKCSKTLPRFVDELLQGLKQQAEL